MDKDVVYIFYTHILYTHTHTQIYAYKGFPGDSDGKNPLAMREIWVRSLGWEDPLEEGMATHSGIFAWRIHGQRSLTGYSPWDNKVGLD